MKSILAGLREVTMGNSKEKVLRTCCVRCGSPRSLQSGMLRCTNPSCGHVHNQAYAFQECVEREPVSRYPEYERQTPKPVDEEFE